MAEGPSTDESPPFDEGIVDSTQPAEDYPIDSPLLGEEIPPLDDDPLESLDYLIDSGGPDDIGADFIPEFPESDQTLEPILYEESLTPLPYQTPDPDTLPPY